MTAAITMKLVYKNVQLPFSEIKLFIFQLYEATEPG